MVWRLFLAIVHHLAAFIITGALVAEFVIVWQKNLNKEKLKALVLADSLYGLFSVVLVGVGLLRVFYFEKGSEFYIQNIFFWLKMIAFAAMGALSIYPTLTYFKNFRKDENALSIDVSTQNKITSLIIVEQLLLLIAVICAALMAKGIGMC